VDFEEKQRFLARQLRAIGKHKSYEQLKQQKEISRARKATRGKHKPARRDWPDDDDEAPLKKIRTASRERAAPPQAAQASGASAALETAQVIGLSQQRARLQVGDEALDAVVPRPDAESLMLAIGDFVRFERRAGGLVLVHEILERKSELSRPDPANAQRRLVLAANVDLAVCVVAAREPTWKPGFVDRVLLAAEQGRVRTSLVVNKIDLLDAAERAALDAQLAPYRAIGVEVHAVSGASGSGISALAAALAGLTCVFVGPSGVGKSSLQNALDPRGERAVGGVRASDGKGRHTTTASELRRCASGARLIDTPGLRQFGLAGFDRRTLADWFPEFSAWASACRFRDCRHLAEPGCGVLEAVQSGRIPPQRHAAYARIAASLE